MKLILTYPNTDEGYRRMGNDYSHFSSNNWTVLGLKKTAKEYKLTICNPSIQICLDMTEKMFK